MSPRELSRSGCSHQLRSAGRAAIHQHCHGQVSNFLLRIGLVGDFFNLLSLQIANHAFAQEEIGHGHAFFFVAFRVIAQIQHQLLCAFALE